MTGLEIAMIAGTAMNAIGSFTAAAGQSQQLEAEAAAAEYNAQVAEQQAAREVEVAQTQAFDFRRSGEETRAATRARLAASGVAVDQDTGLLIQQEQAGEIERGVQRILQGGDIAAIRQQQEAELNRLAGRSARSAARSTLISGGLGAGGTLLTGVGNTFID